MGISSAHLAIIIHNVESQPLKFLFEGELNKIVSSYICSSSVLLAIQSVISMKGMILSTLTHIGGILEGWDRQADE